MLNFIYGLFGQSLNRDSGKVSLLALQLLFIRYNVKKLTSNHFLPNFGKISPFCICDGGDIGCDDIFEMSTSWICEFGFHIKVRSFLFLCLKPRHVKCILIHQE